MNMKWNDIFERAVWTFLEGFLIALPAALTLDMSNAAWKAAILGAAMAGLSALKTFFIDLAKARKEKYLSESE